MKKITDRLNVFNIAKKVVDKLEPGQFIRIPYKGVPSNVRAFKSGRNEKFIIFDSKDDLPYATAKEFKLGEKKFPVIEI